MVTLSGGVQGFWMRWLFEPGLVRWAKVEYVEMVMAFTVYLLSLWLGMQPFAHVGKLSFWVRSPTHSAHCLRDSDLSRVKVFHASVPLPWASFLHLSLELLYILGLCPNSFMSLGQNLARDGNSINDHTDGWIELESWGEDKNKWKKDFVGLMSSFLPLLGQKGSFTRPDQSQHKL